MNPRERALELLERFIRDGRRDDADPAATARECLLALEGLGYRPTEARPAADWRTRGTGSEPGEDYRAALAEIRRKAARSARELGHDVPADLAADETGDAA